MREADRWLGFAKQDLRVAELALGDGIYNQYFTKARTWRSLPPELRWRAHITQDFRDLLIIKPAFIPNNVLKKS